MNFFGHPTRLAPAVVAVAACGLAGCGSMTSLTSGIGGGMFGGGDAGKGAATASGNNVTTESLLTAAKADGPSGAGAETAPGCPRVTIYEPGRVGDALGVLHRGEITKTARECTVEAGRVTIKYGFSGRILLGPKGKNGNVQLPLTVYVADAKRERVLNDKLRIDVPIALDKPIGYFSTIREISFQIPEGARAGEFEVFVGFDRNIPNAG
jgi:hypothetical protein